jgi:hypothetical protein
MIEKPCCVVITRRGPILLRHFRIVKVPLWRQATKYFLCCIFRSTVYIVLGID